MNWNYETYMTEQLTILQNEMQLSSFKFFIENEQSFIKRKTYDEDTIYIIIKYLTDSKSIGAVIQPVQFLILTENNSLDVAKALFDRFATDYNWEVVISGNEYIKQQYTSPVVLSNFNPVLYGYRSVMYMTSNLYVMTNLIDFRRITVTVDDTEVEIEPLNFTLSYSMQTNTQQTATEEIASSMKSVSNLSVSMTIPMQSNEFVNEILGIIAESVDGNESFLISLYTELPSDDELDEPEPLISKNMKCISAQITTAVNQIPSIQVGLLK